MVSDKYQFSRIYQDKLVSLLIQNGTSLLAEGCVKPEYFEDPDVAVIVSKIIRLTKKYGSASPSLIRESLQNQERVKKLRHRLRKLRVVLHDSEVKFLTEKVFRFARHQALKTLVRDSYELLKQDKQEEIWRALEKAQSIGKSGSQGIGDFYFETLSQRIRQRMLKSDVLMSYIPALDECLDCGGFARQEENVFLGTPSSGKSFALDHMAKVAVLQKKKVIMYTLEMGVSRVAARLDASFSGIMIRELRDKVVKLEKKMRPFATQYGNSLLIKQFPAGVATVGMLRSHLASLRTIDFVPDVVIVDYINLLKQSDDVDSRYEGLGKVYIDLRALATEENVWFFTAAQSNRPSYDSGLITMKNIAESFQGAMHSDVIISLNRSDKEADDERIRLYVAKDRNGLDKAKIKGYTNFKYGSFWKRGMEEKEK